jgi:hypothetical protein
MNYQPQPGRLRTVVYAQTRAGEQPFPVTIDLRPYVANEPSTTVFLEAGPAGVARAPVAQPETEASFPFSCCRQFWSGFLLLWSFGMSVTAFVFFIFIVTDSISNDYYSTSLSWSMAVVCVVLYSIVMVLRLIQAIAGCGYTEIQEKLAASVSLFLPGLKYHVFRTNQNF